MPEFMVAATETTVSVPDSTFAATDLTGSVAPSTDVITDFTDAVAPMTHCVTELTDSTTDSVVSVTELTDAVTPLTVSVIETVNSAAQKATVSGKRSPFRLRTCMELCNRCEVRRAVMAGLPTQAGVRVPQALDCGGLTPLFHSGPGEMNVAQRPPED